MSHLLAFWTSLVDRPTLEWTMFQAVILAEKCILRDFTASRKANPVYDRRFKFRETADTLKP